MAVMVNKWRLFLFLGAHPFLQLGCFGLDITFFVFAYSKTGLWPALGLPFTSLFSLLQEGVKQL